jgi:hypothetical protein
MEYLYIYGLLMGVIVIYIFFGIEIKCGVTPKIIINIHPFIVDSKIYIGNTRIHHWLVGILVFLICLLLQLLNYENSIIYFLYGFTKILIIHGLFYQDCFDFR